MIPDADKSRAFWSSMWDCPLQHRQSPKCLRKIEKELDGVEVQEDIQTDLSKIKTQVSRMLNWKCPSLDEIKGYWIQNLSSLHSRTGNKLNRCLQKTLLCIKEVEKGNALSNARLVTCLPFFRKRLTGVLAEKL